MNSPEYLICTACGTQYDISNREGLGSCNICEDPRQYVPRSGQQWTTLTELRKTFKNKWRQDSANLWVFWTEPQFAIGQAARLIVTPHGNVLWDLISLIDDDTVDFINSLGGIKTIVISHPHWYTTYAEWAKVFKCKVQVSSEDKKWLFSGLDCVDFIKNDVSLIVEGVTAYKAGGHFDGSLLLHWEDILFLADTVMQAASALTPAPRPKGHIYFTFQWSIPNMIPLSPDQIYKIWAFIKPLNFESARGVFEYSVFRGQHLKRELIENAKVQVKAMGWENHLLLHESA